MPYNIIPISISSSQLVSFANPESITRIIINPPYNVADLEHLTKFTNLKSIAFNEIYNLDLSNVKLPSSLEKIDLSNVELPQSLEKIDLSDCENLKKLPNDFFSNLINLKELDLYSSGIEDLSNVKLPSSFEKINLSWCKNLKKLPDLSNCTNLNSIDLTGCDSLPNNSETIKQLLDLEDKNAHNPQFSLKWPAHINRDAIVTEIKDSIKNSYKKY